MAAAAKKPVFNPYLPLWEFVPDGEPHVFGNRLYIYGSHDVYGGSIYCEAPYTVWSAPLDDLSNWTNHGITYTGKEDPFNDNGKHRMFAPDVCEKNGKYYLYYGLDTADTISVAMSDKPEGPFHFYGHVHYSDGTIWGKKPGEHQCFDPGIFVDDDGQVYLYSGFSTSYEVMERIRKKLPPELAENFSMTLDGSDVVRLDEDMLTIKEGPYPCLPGVANSAGTGFEGHEFFEASSLRKFNGRYYAIYSSVNGHELCYAMSDNPMSGFEYKGVLHSNGNFGLSEDGKPEFNYANNHGSAIELNGNYYIFGHRHTGRSQYQRQGVAEKLTMNPDGTFNQALMTSCGLHDGPLPAQGKFPASIACVLKGPKGAVKADEKTDYSQSPVILLEDGVSYLANLRAGSIVGYRYFQVDPDHQHVELALSVQNLSGEPAIVEVSFTPDGEVVAFLEVAPTICENLPEKRDSLNLGKSDSDCIQKRFQTVHAGLDLPDEAFALYCRVKNGGPIDLFGFKMS